MARQGKINQALAYLDNIQPKTEKQKITVIQAKSVAHTSIKQHLQAKEVIDNGLIQYPNNRDLVYDQAILLEATGNVEQAEKNLRQLLQLNPSDPQANNALGYFLSEHYPDRYSEALAFIDIAHLAQPDDASVLDSKGWTLHRLERNEEALQYLLLAYQKAQYPEIAAHLGAVLWRLDNRESARVFWGRALDKDPSNEYLLNTIRRVTNKIEATEQ